MRKTKLVLTTDQRLALIDYLAEFNGQGAHLNRQELAALATSALGFHVTKGHVMTAQKKLETIAAVEKRQAKVVELPPAPKPIRVKEVSVRVNGAFEITDGVALVLDQYSKIGVGQVADMLREIVQRDCPVGDDAGLEWFYDELDCIVFIGGNRQWIASRDARHIELLRAADIIDGSDYSAVGNGLTKKNLEAGADE